MSTQCWMRKIRIELYSKITMQKIVIGDKDNEISRDNLKITVTGNKYAAINKDKGVVTIYNLNYQTITNILLGQYYKIKIFVGYRNQGNLDKVFDGSVSFISKKIHSNHDTECYIAYASDMVAAFSQSRMNFNITSGINVAAAIDYLMFTNGVTNINVDNNLRKQVINQYVQNYNSNATVLDSVIKNNTQGTFTFSTSGEEGNVVNVISSEGKRFIKIDMSKIPIGKSNPRVDSNGLTITLLPTRPYSVGEVLVIDNSLIDVSVISSDVSNKSSFNANYMDSHGCYMIREIAYTFENRGPSFEYNITAKALDIFRNLTGK